MSKYPHNTTVNVLVNPQHGDNKHDGGTRKQQSDFIHLYEQMMVQHCLSTLSDKTVGDML